MLELKRLSTWRSGRLDRDWRLDGIVFSTDCVDMGGVLSEYTFDTSKQLSGLVEAHLIFKVIYTPPKTSKIHIGLISDTGGLKILRAAQGMSLESDSKCGLRTYTPTPWSSKCRGVSTSVTSKPDPYCWSHHLVASTVVVSSTSRQSRPASSHHDV